MSSFVATLDDDSLIDLISAMRMHLRVRADARAHRTYASTRTCARAHEQALAETCGWMRTLAVREVLFPE